jgi:hypothetical protein
MTMQLPFTTEQFLQVFRQYNEGVWPAQILLNTFAVIAIVLAFQKKAYSGKIISYILAFFWYWTGLIYHAFFFSSINPAAYVFGGACVLQGGLFHWIGGFKNRMEYRARFDVQGSTGAILMLYALVIYPLLGYWAGHGYPHSPTFGAPCPTTIFTFGLLLWTVGKLPRYLLIIPALWSLVGFSAAVTLGIKEDIGLVVAGILGVSLLIFSQHRAELQQS